MNNGCVSEKFKNSRGNKGVVYVEATEAAASVKNICKNKYKDN
jgi:hypothetical protein